MSDVRVRKSLRKAADSFDVEYYRRFLGNQPKTASAVHWEKADKTTFTLFNVLIDQDLTELVRVLEHFPEYIPLLCAHFRYSYSYNENPADRVAASKLIMMGEPHMTKQFLRNVLAKLEGVEDLEIEEVKVLVENLQDERESLHPLVLKFYCVRIRRWMEDRRLHLLQRKILEKPLHAIEPEIELDILPEDRDKEVLIPYAV